MDQGNSTETPEINSDMYGQLIFNTAGKNIQKRKDTPFNKCYWGSWTSTY